MEGEDKEIGQELTPTDIYYIAKAAYELGIKKFKITGGEPLVRTDIVDIVGKLSSLKPLDLAITTNGYYLPDYISDLVKAGLKRINVSLPALNHEVYKAITGVDGLDRVLDGIERAKNAGLHPIKLNFVYLRNINESELWNVLSYARKNKLILQVIELEPVGIPRELFAKLYRDTKSFEKEISRKAVKVIRRRHMHNRPQYFLPDGSIIEIVRSNCNPTFCKHCTRLRLTADGHLKTCLLRDRPLINVLSILRSKDFTSGERGIIERIKNAIKEINSLREPYYK